MDPDLLRRDARAVVDPIAAIFDLAESVDRQTPKIRRMLRYVRVFVSLWLFLDFVLMMILSAIPGGGSPALAFLLFFPIVGLLLGTRYVSDASTRLALFILACVLGAFQALSLGGLLFLGAVLVALFILGFVILELLQDLRSFFGYFALRHRVVERVRSADPVVHVPQGKDAATRMLGHLSATSPDVRAVLAIPGALAAPALLTGRSGLTYAFDAVVRSEPTAFARITGLGPAGFAVFLKAFDAAPTVSDLQALKRAVEDVAAATRVPPARVLALWRAQGDASVTPDAYDFLTRETIVARIRGSTYACSIELAREGDDGTYDFIPLVVEATPSVPMGGAVRA